MSALARSTCLPGSGLPVVRPPLAPVHREEPLARLRAIPANAGGSKAVAIQFTAQHDRPPFDPPRHVAMFTRQRHFPGLQQRPERFFLGSREIDDPPVLRSVGDLRHPDIVGTWRE